MKINKTSYSRTRIGLASAASSCGLVLVLVAALLCPAACDTSVFATDGNADASASNSDAISDETSNASNNNDIMPLAEERAATASLTIDGSTATTVSEEIKAVHGNTAYSKIHKVAVAASNISDYELKLSGATNLMMADGTTPTTTIGSANGATGSNMADNTWGYTWADSITDTAAQAYSGLTPNGAEIAAGKPITNNAVNFSIDLAFAAKFGTEQASGIYKAEVTLSLVTTPTAITRTLTYNANGGSGGTTTQTCADYGTGCNITMAYTAPTRSGYDFQGWGDNTSTVNSNYGTGKTVALTADKTIYAIWKSQDPWANITTMQQMTTAACSAASVGKSKTLTDSRDNSTYNVQKYPDGKCWMTQNLKIMGSRTLTSSDSNVSSNYTLPASNVSSFNTSDTTQATYLGADDKGVATGYYTWCAATAGTCSSATSTGAHAPSSICPKGWRLPGGYNDATYGNEFYDLFKNMGLTISGSLASTSGGYTNWGTGDLSKVQSSPYNFNYTGYVYNGSYDAPASNQGGSWWSSTAYSSTNAYLMYVYSSYVYPGTDYNYRRAGYAVRCVAQ